MTPSEIFAKIESDLKADADNVKANIDGVFKFVLSGDGGGTWVVDAKEVAVTAGDGDAECTITMEAEDFIAVNDGSLDAMQAFMMGKIQVDGDMGLAMKLQEIL